MPCSRTRPPKAWLAGLTIGACVALAERSLLAIAAGAWEAGEQHLAEAWSLARNANTRPIHRRDDFASRGCSG